ncbi:cbb3-type cytochrome oxidase assembly protein CcoS [Paraglaciecola marina]|uniref:cbb3-type cytochrome oxidase assembly protein CcoS n=1 Tax=Paraglaciecola marina TaxID=2500157 RepID=UPI001414EAFB|nr:cbb3-type cytochrome oxidase assembly protein CcoS [Paraglaciecola marina]
MSIIYVLIPIAILLVCIAVFVFFWAVKSNQFDDLERHGSSILFDDDLPKHKQNSTPPTPEKHE